MKNRNLEIENGLITAQCESRHAGKPAHKEKVHRILRLNSSCECGENIFHIYWECLNDEIFIERELT